MKTGQIPTWLRNAGSLTALGSLGGSLGYLTYGAYPAVKDAGLSAEQLAALGGAIGSALHFIGLPVLRYVFDYIQLGEVATLRKVGVMRSDEADDCRKHIIEHHFPSSPLEGHASKNRSKSHTKGREPKRQRQLAMTTPNNRLGNCPNARVLGRRASKAARNRRRRR